MGMRLDRKVADSYGWGTGIGAAVAERFACEGAKVVICGRRAEPLEKVKQKVERAGGQVMAVPCDSATEAGVKHLFEQALQAFGTVDILVNDAGHRPRPDGPPQAAVAGRALPGAGPLVTREIFRIVRLLNEQEGITVLLVEQNARLALDIARRGYVLETGRVVLSDLAENLRRNEEVRCSYLGY